MTCVSIHSIKKFFLGAVINKGTNLTAVTFQQAYAIFLFFLTLSLESNYFYSFT